MANLFYTKVHRLRSRRLAVDCYCKCDGSVENAYALAKTRLREVGNPLVMLTIASITLQVIYYGLKIWREWNLTVPPLVPVEGEGFGLGPGEPYALSESEILELREGSQ